MPEEESAAAQEAFKLRRCKHPDCIFRTTAQGLKDLYNCSYAEITRSTRLAKHPPDKRQPADCEEYKPRTLVEPKRQPRRKPFEQI